MVVSGGKVGAPNPLDKIFEDKIYRPLLGDNCPEVNRCIARAINRLPLNYFIEPIYVQLGSVLRMNESTNRHYCDCNKPKSSDSNG